MTCQQAQIFVLDIAERPAVAFEARSMHAAEQLVRSPWLIQALDQFCSARRPAPAAQAPRHLRAATEGEAALYRDRADEFSEPTPQFLIAHLTET